MYDDAYLSRKIGIFGLLKGRKIRCLQVYTTLRKSIVTLICLWYSKHITVTKIIL